MEDELFSVVGKVREESVILDEEYPAAWREGGMSLKELMGKDDGGIRGHDSTLSGARERELMCRRTSREHRRF